MGSAASSFIPYEGTLHIQKDTLAIDPRSPRTDRTPINEKRSVSLDQDTVATPISVLFDPRSPCRNRTPIIKEPNREEKCTDDVNSNELPENIPYSVISPRLKNLKKRMHESIAIVSPYDQRDSKRRTCGMYEMSCQLT